MGKRRAGAPLGGAPASRLMSTPAPLEQMRRRWLTKSARWGGLLFVAHAAVDGDGGVTGGDPTAIRSLDGGGDDIGAGLVGGEDGAVAGLGFELNLADVRRDGPFDAAGAS